MRFFKIWLIQTVAILAIPYLMHSIHVDNVATGVVVALALGLVNVLIRPILIVLTLPVTFLTLGLFIFVINGLMFWGVASVVDGFYVAGFWSAVGGAMLYNVISWALSTLLLEK